MASAEKTWKDLEEIAQDRMVWRSGGPLLVACASRGAERGRFAAKPSQYNDLPLKATVIKRPVSQYVNKLVHIPVKFEVISETALGTIESVLPHCDVSSACVHHTQSYYPDTGPTRLKTKSIMPDTRRISC
ncbi:hypothetical protein ElyMa_005262500 [Elysia marginata]|uniref:Uncharacterized protein n=1 Tax=Elysia marginata TaxID=1093978 RepID=A0AAV4JYK3_9GAST|nr:hypothetical protein ElyMa_005262500 [Elysia marginata]